MEHVSTAPGLQYAASFVFIATSFSSSIETSAERERMEQRRARKCRTVLTSSFEG